MLKKFESLANDIETEWSSSGKNLEVFPKICRRHLEGWNVPWSFAEFIEILINSNFSKYQSFPRAEFAQPPITLVRREDFHIDVYFWLDLDTSIHNHHFVGAFRPIYGRSVHHSFAFQEEKVWETNVRTGKLSLIRSEPVPTPQAIEIHPEDAFIHLVEHVEYPTVTVCVRTPNLPAYQISSFLFPGLRLTQDSQFDRKRLLIWKILAETQQDFQSTSDVLFSQLSLRDILYGFLRENVFMKDFTPQVHRAFTQHVTKNFPEFAMIPLQHSMALKQIVKSSLLGNES